LAIKEYKFARLNLKKQTTSTKIMMKFLKNKKTISYPSKTA